MSGFRLLFARTRFTLACVNPIWVKKVNNNRGSKKHFAMDADDNKIPSKTIAFIGSLAHSIMCCSITNEARLAMPGNI